MSSVVQAGRCYVTDRGYTEFAFFNQINSIGSGYICRARANSTPKILKERQFTDADRQVGVRIDREVVLDAHTSNSKTVPTDYPGCNCLSGG